MKIIQALKWGLVVGLVFALLATVCRQIVVSHDSFSYGWNVVVNFGLLGCATGVGIYLLTTCEQLDKWCREKIWN